MQKFLEEKAFRILVFIFIVILIIIGIEQNDTQISSTTIESSDELSEILSQENVTIIDVRTESEYEEGHLPNAINIPYDTLEDEINYNTDLTIVVYSSSDPRSHLAATILEDMGYTNVYEASLTDYDGDLVTD